MHADAPNLTTSGTKAVETHCWSEVRELRVRVKLFKRSYAFVRRLPAFVGAIHSFLWLHALSERDLNDLVTDTYAGDNGDSFKSEDHNFGGLWEWEKAAFQESFAGCKSILVAAAGGGREMIALAKMGFDVSGFDASEGLATICKENLRAVTVAGQMTHAPPGQVPTDLKIYDALVIGRGAYHHIPGRENRIRFLAGCREKIKGKAPVYVGDFFKRTEDSHRLTNLSPFKVVERGDSANYSFFHYFTRAEIELELHEAGFEKVEFRLTPLPGSEGKVAHVLARSKDRA